MKKTTTSVRLKEIMNTRNLRQVDILNKCQPFCAKYRVRLGRNDLSQYVSGKVEPGQEKLSVLSSALDVNEAWLMGYDVPMDSSYTPFYKFSSETFAASPDGRKLISTYLSLNEEGRKQLFIQCDLLLSSDIYTTGNMPVLLDQLSLLPAAFSEPYTKSNKADSLLNAANERTDIEVTEDMKKHDNDIMDDENFED